MQNKCAYLISCLFDVRNQIHTYHLQTNSYATHVALNEFYEEIVDLTDRFAESAQGKYGIITGYKSELSEYDEGNPLKYLKTKLKMIEEYREYFQESPYLQQIIDDIIELFYSTIYKLTNLK
jgi:hypothetical protein